MARDTVHSRQTMKAGEKYTTFLTKETRQAHTSLTQFLLPWVTTFPGKNADTQEGIPQ